MYCNAMFIESQADEIFTKLKNGYAIKFAEVLEEEMIRASQESFLCKYDAIEKLFDKCIRKI